MSSRMTKELVINALFRAAANKRPAKGLILHSDRGSQNYSHDFTRSLCQFGMIVSMSRRGNCFDNAPMESFWGTLKTEMIYGQDKFRTRKEAELAIREYIDVFYNRQRIQKSWDMYHLQRLNRTIKRNREKNRSLVSTGDD